MRGAAAPLALLALLVVLVAACGGDDGEDEATAGGDCEVTALEGEDAPEVTLLEEGAEHRITFRTSEGSFTIRLDIEAAPCTAASFAALARRGFFDGTTFHRIVPGFVIQGGDPTGTGMGGPGYTTRDVPAADTTYRKGIVAMAKTGSDPPGTAGSQFFIVTGADAGLPPDYAVLGRVVDGLEVVERIGRLGDPRTERPTQPVTIRAATVLGS